MNLALITAKQVVVLFILIMSGFVCVKTKAVKIEGKKSVLGFAFVPCCSGNDNTFIHNGF